jgi:protein-S-isoprenylcysteine O-methyltransferase Ste14
MRSNDSGVFRRQFADLVLLCVTAAELTILYRLSPAFTITDWVYVLQHVLVLGIALTRRPPQVQDRSPASSAAVIVAYVYSYAQVIYLQWTPGQTVSTANGFVMVTFAAGLSLFSLVSLGRLFGVRPALRGLVTRGPYRFVRHPMYLSYVIADIGYGLQERNAGTMLIVMAGWVSLLYRIKAEERVLAQHGDWPKYARSVRYRLLPGVW